MVHLVITYLQSISMLLRINNDLYSLELELLVFWTPVRLRPAPPLWGCNWNSTGYDNDKSKITCGGNSQKVANKQLAITNYQWLLKRNSKPGFGQYLSTEIDHFSITFPSTLQANVMKDSRPSYEIQVAGAT